VRHEIRDLDGALKATHIRHEFEDGTKSMPWEPAGVKPTALPLYGINRTVDTPDGDQVIVTEGEKSADSLWARGFLSVGTVTGAGIKKPIPCDESLAPLLRLKVFLWPDNDEIGRDHMHKIERRLIDLGHRDVWQIVWQEAPPKGDAADYQGNLDELFKQAVFVDPAHARPGQTSHDDEPDTPTEYSDLGMSNRFVACYGQDLRFVSGAWFYYDEEPDHRWVRDELLRPYTWARRICTQAAQEAFASLSDKNPARAAELANVLTSNKKIAAVVSLARSHPRIAASANQFEVDIWTINTPGGAVNLRDGTIRLATREDYFTKCTVVAPSPMPTPEFDEFLSNIMGMRVPIDICSCAGCAQSVGKPDKERQAVHDEETRARCAYLLRLYGWSLSGDVSEQVLPILHGDGGNGKSLLNDLLAQDIYGLTPRGYACVLPIEALLSSRGERHPTELSDLFRVRLALAREPDEGVRWDEGKVKLLTGSDPIVARRMRQDFFTFQPTHHLIPFGNSRPVLRGGDQMAWKRRVHLIEFPQHFADEPDPSGNILKADKQLRQKLRAEAPGILQKLIRACLEYQKIGGLNAPETVKVASAEYLRQQNGVGRFIDEFCDRSDPHAETTVQDLWRAFDAWATSNKEFSGIRRDFNDKLERQGIKIVRLGTRRGVCRGIRLMATEADLGR